MPRTSKSARLWILVLQAGLLASCSTAPSPERDDAAESARKELAEEVNVGRGMAASILGRYKLVTDLPKLSDYVRAVGESVHARVGRPELTPRFAIVDSPAPNAFAAPGGFVFVTRGLVRGLKSEDELVGVLAHEIAHINEKHVFQKVRAKKATGTFILARLLSGGRGDMGQAVSKAVGQGLKLLLESGLGPELEHEADVKGAEMAAILGYEPRALGAYLRRTFSEEKVDVPGTHPPLQARLQALEKGLQAGGVQALRSTIRLSRGVAEARRERFRRAMAGFVQKAPVPQETKREKGA